MVRACFSSAAGCSLFHHRSWQLCCPILAPPPCAQTVPITLLLAPPPPPVAFCHWPQPAASAVQAPPPVAYPPWSQPITRAVQSNEVGQAFQAAPPHSDKASSLAHIPSYNCGTAPPPAMYSHNYWTAAPRSTQTLSSQTPCSSECLHYPGAP